jgi:carboxypeptidase C (cathepsin A)
VASAAHPAPRPLPPASVTRHTLDLPGRTLHFTATAGSIRLPGPNGVPEADIAFIAYTLDGARASERPVSFVLNGGPGDASAWLQLGSLGPWLLPLGGATPSTPPLVIPNADTWLDFTDLVFIDPVGTGFSRFLTTSAAVRKRMWSVSGDIDEIAETIRRWTVANNRVASPKYIVGESYGGFRAPKLARALASDQGIGISGLVMISPALTIGRVAGVPLIYAETLPSMVAAVRARNGPVTRAALADVEQYATHEYLADLLAGVGDPKLLAQMSAHVASFTGLDPALVRRLDGRIAVGTFLREIDRAEARVASPYDATITGPNPYPARIRAPYADPVLDGFVPPLTEAMLAIYADRLKWLPEGHYQLSNLAVTRHWDWGGALGQVQSIGALRTALALDPRMHVLIGDGLYDLVVPYLRNSIILAQIPPSAGGNRIRMMTLPGGHMFYTEDASRAAFRAAAEQMYEGLSAAANERGPGPQALVGSRGKAPGLPSGRAQRPSRSSLAAAGAK